MGTVCTAQEKLIKDPFSGKANNKPNNKTFNFLVNRILKVLIAALGALYSQRS